MARTLKDIARELNLSITTVSRVVNGEKYVKPEKRELVLEALSRHNYVPNHVARSLKRQTTKTIGVIIPDISEYSFASVIQGIDNTFSQQGYSILLSDSRENPDREEQLIQLMYQKRIDALVLATVSEKHAAVNMFFQNSIPVVFIDNLPHLETGFDAVLINNAEASQMAVSHLVNLHHRRIAIITGNYYETTGYERLEGYKRALQIHGLELDESLIRYGNYKEETGYSLMKELLQQREEHPFTAVYVISEKMTFGAVKAIKESGLMIPQDISLVGFDVHDKTGLIQPGITSITQPEQQIGSYVAEVLLKKLKQGKKQGGEPAGDQTQRIMLEPRLVIRESTRKL